MVTAASPLDVPPPESESWSRFRRGLAPDAPVPAFILESWRRCRSFGVATGQTTVPFVGEEARDRRVDAAAELVALARGHLRWLGASVAHLPFHCVMLTDADGVIVDSTGNLPDVMDRFGLRAGHRWAEEAMGTNGIGTALAAGRPVAVVGDEHYVEAIHGYTCVGAPIPGGDGRPVGAVDLCTTATDGDPSRLVLVAWAANVLGSELAYRTRAAAEGDRLALVAHELNTPLAALSLLSRRLHQATEADSAARALALRFDRQLERLLALTGGLLELSGRRADTVDTARPLEDIVREAAADYEEVGEQAGRPLRIVCEAALVARWDRRRIGQVTTNLVSNAYKYGQRGPVEVRVAGSDGVARIEVTDQGPGIAAAHRQQVFERGRRGPDATGQPGAGLGLWIVAELCQALGGRVEVEGPPGGGTTFVVTLPVPGGR